MFLRNALDGQEFSSLWRLSMPVVITYTLQMSLTLVMLFFVGHHGNSIELGAAALGNLYCSITGFTLGIGLATAMDTLSSQAYGQNSKSPLVGIIFQRAMAIMCAISLPITVIWWNAGDVLRFFGQHEEVVDLALVFSRWMIPGLLPYLIFECLKKYLQTQGMVVEMMYGLLCSSIFNIFCHYFLMYTLDFGFIGAPMALSLTHISLPFFTLIFARYTGAYRDTWYGWSKQAFADWGPFLKLGVPGMLMICAEWWAAEAIALAAGFIGEKHLAAQSIIATTNAMVFMVPFGISVSVNTRVGNLLGSGSPDRAKKSCTLAILINCVFCFLTFFVLMYYRHIWGYLFTNDLEVVELVSEVLAIYAIAQIFDGLQGVEAGILRGIGKQKIGSILNFVAYYILGIPVALYLTFHAELGIGGLWWGMCLAFSSCTIFYTLIIARADWKKESLIAQERAKRELEKLMNRPSDDLEANFLKRSGHE